MLYFLAYSIVVDNEAAKDIVQDAFIKILIYARTIKDNKNFDSWISKTTKNIALDYLRKRKEHIELTDKDIDKISFDSFDRRFDYKIEFNASKKDMLIITYHLVYGLSHKEIAKMLGMTYESVVKRYNRALQKIRLEYLDDEKVKYPVK